MPTLRAIIEKQHVERPASLTPTNTDELFIRIPKLVFGSWVLRKSLNLLWNWFARLWLRKELDKDFYGKRATAAYLLRNALDWHALFMTALLLLAYSVLYLATVCMPDALCARSPTWPGLLVVLSARLAVGLALLVSLYRVYELVWVLASLFLKRGYRCFTPMRSVFRVFSHYVDFTIAFGSFYLIAFFFGDAFSPQAHSTGMAATWFTPFYFSFVTMTTLGYGDFAPQAAITQGLVVIQVLLGFMLLVVVLGHILSFSLPYAEKHARHAGGLPHSRRKICLPFRHRKMERRWDYHSR